MVMPVLCWYQIKAKKIIERLSHIKKPYAISLALTLSWARWHLLHLADEKTEAKRHSATCPQTTQLGQSRAHTTLPLVLATPRPRHLLPRACADASSSPLSCFFVCSGICAWPWRSELCFPQRCFVLRPLLPE